LTTISARFFTGLALSATIIFAASFASHAQQPRLVQSQTSPNGFPAARCSRPADQEALRIKLLIEFVEKSRHMAAQNPLLLADVSYYEAELAASRRCLQSFATR